VVFLMKTGWLAEITFILLLAALVAVCVPDVIERCLAASLPQPVPAESANELAPAEIEAEVIRLVNQERAAMGLRPLRVDPTLTRVARLRSQDMVQRAYFDHRDPVTRELLAFQLLAEQGVSGGGENLFLTGVRPAEAPACAVRWWMDSHSHRDNILRASYRQTGVGVAVRGQDIYITQIFAGEQPDRG
jgi:uncharacterized protein YkwD